MASKPEVSASPSRFYAFFSNPLVGIVGTAASIVSVLLAVYFYFGSVSYPELVYFVNPVRTIVVKQGTTSRLGVVFDGHALAQDVTASQVAIWNRGRQAIRRAAILQAVTIITEPRVPILEATIRKTSRDVVGVDLDRTRLAEGEVPVSWNILEEGDGGVVQIVYAGDVGTQIRCRGVIEGQRGVRGLKVPRGTIESPENQLRFPRLTRYALLVVALLMLIVIPLNLIVRHVEIALSYGWSRLRLLLFSVGVPIVIAGALFYMFLQASVPAPPFGF
ncbi:MAG: hypothetical protein ABSF14_16210 [Terriglobia bacterium]|jgi:hypothetical protein